MAKYKHNEKPEEEYIDLVPILENLYFDVDKFLNPIKGVEVANGWCETSCGRGRHDCKWLCIYPLHRRILNDIEIRKIQEFIKQNYQEIYGEVTRRPVAPFLWKTAKFIGRGSEE